MNIAARWQPSTIRDGGEYYVCNRIILARFWPTANGWQIAIKLPLEHFKPQQFVFPEKEQARKCIETCVEQWFTVIDA